LLRLVDLDTAAFNKVMDANRLPKGTDEQNRGRDEAVEAATREATLVPFEVLKHCRSLVALAETAARRGNRNSVSDAGVAALTARAAAEGAYYNVLINLQGMKDVAFKEATAAEAHSLREDIRRQAAAVNKKIEKEFEPR